MKNKNLIFSGLLLSGVTALSGCCLNCDPGQIDDYKMKILSPMGNVTAAMFPYDANLSTNSDPSMVNMEFKARNYDVIIFDMLNGLKNIKNNNLDFKLYLPVTSGNFHLVSINSGTTDKPTSGSKVIVFGQGLVADTVFKKLYPEVTNISYVASVQDTVLIGKTGMYEGTKYDYVLSAYPALANILVSSSEGVNPTLVSHLGEEWKTKFGSEIPQAGLFMRNNAFAVPHPEISDAFLLTTELQIAGLINDPTSAINFLDEKYPSNELQSSRFGYTSTIFKEAVTTTPNAFGFTTTLTKEKVQQYLNVIGDTADYNDYIAF